jgi:hypothetical protein
VLKIYGVYGKLILILSHLCDFARATKDFSAIASCKAMMGAYSQHNCRNLRDRKYALPACLTFTPVCPAETDAASNAPLLRRLDPRGNACLGDAPPRKSPSRQRRLLLLRLR